MDDAGEALLALVVAQPGLSAAKACKRLGLSRSQLQRCLTTLGPDIVRVDDDDERQTLWPATPALVRVEALRLDADAALAVPETLAEETPVALLYNGVPHVVMMATPLDLADFAVGFSLTEGVVDAAPEIEVVDVLRRERGLVVHLSIPSARFDALQQRRRALVGRSGCGLCGAEALDTAVREVKRVDRATQVLQNHITAAFAQLAAAQPLNAQCGALHAAGAMVGDALLVREDVGRHNALDKVVGALARNGWQADALLVTSRASYELVHKTAQAGIPLLAAVSAPTAYAVRLAQEAGLTLVAFARGERMTVYAGVVAGAKAGTQ